MKNDIEPTKKSEEGAKFLKEVFYKTKLDKVKYIFLSRNLNLGKQSGYYLGSTDFHTILNEKRKKSVGGVFNQTKTKNNSRTNSEQYETIKLSKISTSSLPVSGDISR